MLKIFIVLFYVSIVFCDDFFGLRDTDALKCSAKEELLSVSPCPPEKTCDNIGIEFGCPAVVMPRSYKCVCKDGFYKSPDGDCITEESCVENYLKSKCGDNEVIKCGYNCPPDKTCETLNQEVDCPPWLQIGRCTYKCICKEGFVRTKDGICVSSDTCV